MNDMVKNTIDARKNAFYSAYNIVDDNLKNKIEELFARIYEFGETCQDAMDFETKFASSSLNQEYINLFTEVASNSEPIQYTTENQVEGKSTSQQVLDEVKSDIDYALKDATLPARRAARQAAYDTARDMPVIGEIMTAKQHIDFFGRFRKKKEDKDEEEENTTNDKK